MGSGKGYRSSSEKKLEEDWDKVSLHINWKLEPCTRPKNDSNAPTLSPAVNTNHIITPNGDATYSASTHDKNIIHTPTTEKSFKSTLNGYHQPAFLEQDQLPQQST